ncbi:MAG: AEC family transporter [Planctomycetota bacterium]|jgi:hypothetical protein|nr:AEC family transporter [Planctomycetota bacterium]
MLQSLLLQLGEIFYFILLPVLLLAGIGYTIQKRLGLDMPTLTRLNFHLVMPGIVYFSLVTSNLDSTAVIQVVVFGVLYIVCMALLSRGVQIVLGTEKEQRDSVMLASMFHNAGNFGLPVQELAFRQSGLHGEAVLLQSFVVIVHNVIGFTAGVFFAARGKGGNWRGHLSQIVKFPPLYAVVAGILTIQARALLGEHAVEAARYLAPFWDTVVHTRSAFAAVALVTIGAQLACIRPGMEPGDSASDSPRAVETTQGNPSLCVLLRLVAGPLVGLALILAMGLEPFIAKVMFINTAGPASLSIMLLCLQFDNYPDMQSRVVLWSTLLAPFSVTVVIYLVQSGMVF